MLKFIHEDVFFEVTVDDTSSIGSIVSNFLDSDVDSLEGNTLSTSQANTDSLSSDITANFQSSSSNSDRLIEQSNACGSQHKESLPIRYEEVVESNWNDFCSKVWCLLIMAQILIDVLIK